MAGTTHYIREIRKKEYYEAYMEQLQDWAESEDTHPMVQTIWKYLQKKSLIQDLIQDHTLELNESGRLTDNVKYQEVPGKQRQCEVYRSTEMTRPAYGKIKNCKKL